jgi:hypothetical protein
MLVYRGAEQILKNVLVIHTEVEFVPMYKNQPLFADIDAHLRERGFAFHRMGVAGRAFKPLIANNNPNMMLSQMLWADAIYIRDFMDFDRLRPLAQPSVEPRMRRYVCRWRQYWELREYMRVLGYRMTRIRSRPVPHQSLAGI